MYIKNVYKNILYINNIILILKTFQLLMIFIKIFERFCFGITENVRLSKCFVL